MTRHSREAAAQAGFTLIEVMIALGLFALIAVAGVGLVDSVIGVQGRTEKRLDRLTDYQRAMFVVTSDLDQIAGGRISGGGRGIAFSRAAPGVGGATVPLRYDLAAGALVRTTGPAPQLLLAGVTGARWRFWDGGWVDRWPRGDDDAARDAWPRAVELTLQLAPGQAPGGTLRRLIVLPRRPVEK